MAGGGVRWLLLQAAGHPVVQGRGIGDQVRMKAPADHGGELVVRRAQVGAQEAPDVRRVALESGVVLVQAGVMMMMGGHQGVKVLVVLLLRPVVERRRSLLSSVSQVM